MRAKCDAIINLPDKDQDSSYCFIIYMDMDEKEACVQVGENHDLNAKDVVIIETYDEQRGVLFYRGTISRTSKDNIYVHKLVLVDEKQRRSDVRVSVAVTLVLKEIFKGVEFIRPNKRILIETVNVSAGGMLLKSELDIKEGSTLTFDFPLESRTLNCKAQIVRKQTADNSFLYGCRLLNDENDRADLRKFVYKTQIKMKKASYEKEKRISG